MNKCLSLFCLFFLSCTESDHPDLLLNKLKILENEWKNAEKDFRDKEDRLTVITTQIDEKTIANCNLVIADDIDQAKLESGDLLNPVSKGLLQWKDVIYFSDIFKPEFKLSYEKNKIFFKSLGIATWDVSIANDIYKKFINSN